MKKSEPESATGTLDSPPISFTQLSKWIEYTKKAFEAGAGWLIDTPSILHVVPFPQMKLNDRFQLHSPNSPAIIWHDDVSEYWWHGVRVRSPLIMRPHVLHHRRILSEPNIELRRVMVERYGIERLLHDAHARVLDEDRDSGGLRQLLRLEMEGDEPLIAVRVSCPSTGRQYILRVPPHTRSCDEAVAWTFGLHQGEYSPFSES